MELPPGNRINLENSATAELSPNLIEHGERKVGASGSVDCDMQSLVFLHANFDQKATLSWPPVSANSHHS